MALIDTTGIRPIDRRQPTDDVSRVRRREEGTSSAFRPQTNVALKTAIQDLAATLGKISSEEKYGIQKMPKEIGDVVKNILRQSLSMDATLGKGIGSTVESQRFSMDQLMLFSRLLSQMGTLAERNYSMKISDETQLLLTSLKDLIVAENGGEELEPVLMTKSAFELVDAKVADELPQALYELLAQLSNMPAVDNRQQLPPSESMQFLKQLVRYFIPRPEVDDFAQAQENTSTQQETQNQPEQQPRSQSSAAQRFLDSMFRNFGGKFSSQNQPPQNQQTQSQVPNQNQPQAQSQVPNQNQSQAQSQVPNQNQPQAQSQVPNQNQSQAQSQVPNQNQPQAQSQAPLNQNPSQTQSQAPLNQNQSQAQSQVPNQNQSQSQSQVPLNQNQSQTQSQVPLNQNQPQGQSQVPLNQNQPQTQSQVPNQNQPQGQSQVPLNQNQPQAQSQVPLNQNQPQAQSQVPLNQNQPQAQSQVPLNQNQPQAQSQVPLNQNQPQAQSQVPNQNQPQTQSQVPNQNQPQTQSQVPNQNQPQAQSQVPFNQNQPQGQQQIPLNQNQPQAQSQVPLNQNQPQAQSQVPLNQNQSQTQSQVPLNQNQSQTQSQVPNQNQPQAQSQVLNQNQSQAQSQVLNQNQPQTQSQVPNQNQPQTQSQVPNQNQQGQSQLPLNQNQPQAQSQVPLNQNQPQGQSQLPLNQNQPQAQSQVPLNQPQTQSQVPNQNQQSQSQVQQSQQPQEEIPLPTFPLNKKFVVRQRDMRRQMDSAKTELIKTNLLNTPQTFNTMKNLAQFLMRNNEMNPRETALLKNFINNSQTTMSETEARHLQNLLRLCQQNIPFTVRQAAVQQNLPDLPRLWAFMQMCDMANVNSKMTPKALKKAGKDVAAFATSMRGAMSSDNAVVQNQRSFQMMIPLFMGDNEMSYPTYFNIYDETENDPDTGITKKETWVRICILTDHVGAAEMVFRIYDETKLDMRFYFSQSEIAKEFGDIYVEELKKSMKQFSLKLGEISVGSVGEGLFNYT